MKRAILTTCVYYLLFGIVYGQAKDFLILSPKEEVEAKALASSFFNRFEKTRDIKPLIKEFFINDFGRRLKFCGTTGICKQVGNEFWQKNEALTGLRASEKDFARAYANIINTLFLFQGFFYYTSLEFDSHSEDFDNISEKKFKAIYLKTSKSNRLLPKPKAFEIFFEGIDKYDNPKTRRELHRYFGKREKLAELMRIIDVEWRNELLKKKKIEKSTYYPNQFEIYAKFENNQYFDYPFETKIISASSNRFWDHLYMDMIRENGRLKIVSVYSPGY
jgi:hypothetical protein